MSDVSEVDLGIGIQKSLVASPVLSAKLKRPLTIAKFRPMKIYQAPKVYQAPTAVSASAPMAPAAEAMPTPVATTQEPETALVTAPTTTPGPAPVVVVTGGGAGGGAPEPAPAKPEEKKSNLPWILGGAAVLLGIVLLTRKKS